MIKYTHTNLIAKDWKKLSVFYQRVFGLKPVQHERDLRGEWLERLTGVKDAHITGEHLAQPGFSDDSHVPTLEIFSYDYVLEDSNKPVNKAGFAHIAFEVDDVCAILEKIKEEGGSQLGDLVSAEYPGDVLATFVYVRDIEGNIIELQNWKKLND